MITHGMALVELVSGVVCSVITSLKRGVMDFVNMEMTVYKPITTDLRYFDNSFLLTSGRNLMFLSCGQSKDM